MTNIKIYQGDQIGGCVTIISYTDSEGKTSRIMVDYGSSLSGGKYKDFSYDWDEYPVDAVFFTHYHGDHVGQIAKIPEGIPLYMGEVAREVMINIQRKLCELKGSKRKEHEKILELLLDTSRVRTFHYNQNTRVYDPVTDIANFVVYPYSVDHSAYDAYMFLFETPDHMRPSGKNVILHTGDFRGHGRRGKALMDMLEYYVLDNKKRQVNQLIIEGTMLSRLGEPIKTEDEMEEEAREYLDKHKYAFLICSSTNLDSLASFYNAAQPRDRRYHRYMYTYNDYVKNQLGTFTETAGKFSWKYRFEYVDELKPDKSFSHPSWEKTKTMLELMEQYGFVAIIKPEQRYEKYIDK